MLKKDSFFLFFGWLMLFFCLCPYINILGLPTNTQPNALICGFIVLLLSKKKRPESSIIKYFNFILLVATITLILSEFTSLEVRDWGNYLSLTLITTASYRFLLHIKGNFYAAFKTVVYLWFIAGFTQLLFNPNFLGFIISKEIENVSSGGRGVTSLAPEPTYYGLVILSFLVIYLINNWYNRSRFLGVIILVQLLFFSLSSTALLTLTIALTIYMCSKFNVKHFLYLGLIFGCIGMIIVFFADSLSETRPFILINLVINEPEIILLTDYSINERLNHVFFPVIGMINNFFLPNGFGNFGVFLIESSKNPKFQIFFQHPSFQVDGKIRILSGYGKVFYELGFIGLIIPVLINKLYFINRQEHIILFAFILFNLLLMMCFPFMTSIVPFIIGNMIFNRTTLKHSLK